MGEGSEVREAPEPHRVEVGAGDGGVCPGAKRRRVLGGGFSDRTEPVALFNRFGFVSVRGGEKQRRSRFDTGRQEVSFGGGVVEARLDYPWKCRSWTGSTGDRGVGACDPVQFSSVSHARLFSTP